MTQSPTTDLFDLKPPTLPPTSTPRRDLVERLAVAERTVEALRARLWQDREVGVAIGIVMVVRGVDAAEAHDLLIETMAQTDRSLEEVAREVIGTGGRPFATSVR